MGVKLLYLDSDDKVAAAMVIPPEDPKNPTAEKAARCCSSSCFQVTQGFSLGFTGRLLLCEVGIYNSLMARPPQSRPERTTTVDNRRPFCIPSPLMRKPRA